jgi:hypothetical protein
VSGQLGAGGPHGREPVVGHLPFIVADRLDQVLLAVGGGGELGGEQRGVTQRRARACAARGAHRMDGVAEQRDPAGRPGGDGHGGPDFDQ